jgi:hypothetical protein
MIPSDPCDGRDWKRLARDCKEDWVRREASTDMPPVVIVERPVGTALGLVVAPSVSRDHGLHAAAVLRSCADAARLVFIVEMYLRVRADPDGPPPARGELQRRWESGDRSGILETLNCLSVESGATANVCTLPYEMRGRFVRWLPEVHDDGPAEGFLPDALREIMAMAPIISNPIAVAYRERCGLDGERALYHSTRAGLRLLAERGYRVFDLVTGRHPQWDK